MKSAIVLISVLLSITFGVSAFYSQSCYMRYRDPWPKRAPVGLLTGLRASLGFSYDLDDPNLSNECRAYFRRFKIAAVVASLAAIAMLALIVLVRWFGLQELLDQ